MAALGAPSFHPPFNILVNSTEFNIHSLTKVLLREWRDRAPDAAGQGGG